MDDLSEVEGGQETSEREGHFSSRNIKTSSHSNQLLEKYHSNQLLEKYLNNQFLARNHPPLFTQITISRQVPALLDDDHVNLDNVHGHHHSLLLGLHTKVFAVHENSILGFNSKVYVHVYFT